nr:HypC/HybG/HupF family hydrogenase formation chaperone [Propionibacterium sp.]
MCVGFPLRIVAITPGDLPMATLDAAGRSASCCLAYVPDARVGDYVLVQGGFAAVLLDAEAAAESLAAFAELGALGLAAGRRDLGNIPPGV